MEPLSDAEKGRLFDAMLLYAETFEEPADFAGNERFTWPAAKQWIDLTYSESVRLTENGKKGGRPKSKNNQQKPNETNGNQLEPNESHKVKESNVKESKIKENNVIQQRFERFWSAYPRHVAKQEAMKRFEKLNPSDDLLETMLKAIEKQKGSEQWTKDNGQYIPHPSTWLNQSRWEDELPAAGTSGKIVNAQGYSQRNYEDEDAAALERMLRGVTA
jgi:hypothetical protein